jgi:hypothetical protein
LLDIHDAVVRAKLSRVGGVEIKFTGDGLLATFGGAARAIDCACAIREAVRILGIQIRVGIQTGEIELRDNDIVSLLRSVFETPTATVAGRRDEFSVVAVSDRQPYAPDRPTGPTRRYRCGSS